MKTWCCLVLALFLLEMVSAEYNLTLLHVNDFKGRFQEFDRDNNPCDEKESVERQCYGGVARLFTAVQKVRLENKNVVFVNGGDEYQDEGMRWRWVQQFKHKPFVQFLSILGYDAMVLGNHEFDGGIKELIPLLDGVNFTIVGSNIDYSGEESMAGKNLAKSVILQKGSEQIGIIGFTTTDTPHISSPGDNLKFNDEVESVQDEATKLAASGVKIIIALGHANLKIKKKIALEVKEVDIVVGGHTKVLLYTGDPPTEEVVVGPYPIVVQEGRLSPALVVEDYVYAKYLGFLQVTFDSNGSVHSWEGNPILLDSSVLLQDPYIMKLMQPYQDKLNSKEQEIVWENESPLQNDGCDSRECALGDLMVDAIRDWYHHKGEPDIIAVWNAGGIRNSLGSGSVRHDDVLSTFPFNSTVSLYKIKGGHLEDVFQQSADKWSNNGFLQVSGVRIVINVSKPLGERLVSLYTCGECRQTDESKPIDPEKEYKVAMSNFLKDGGDKHTSLRDNTTDYKNQNFLDIDIILKYLKKTEDLIKEDILDCRIQILSGKEENPACQSSSNENGGGRAADPAANPSGQSGSDMSHAAHILTWSCLTVVIVISTNFE